MAQTAAAVASSGAWGLAAHQAAMTPVSMQPVPVIRPISGQPLRMR